MLVLWTVAATVPPPPPPPSLYCPSCHIYLPTRLQPRHCQYCVCVCVCVCTEREREGGSPIVEARVSKSVSVRSSSFIGTRFSRYVLFVGTRFSNLYTAVDMPA
jgi:hypothetical protein